jgi:hypothetical protein
MSRHFIDAFDSSHVVTVGWDRPMNTFFAQVFDEDDRALLDVGGPADVVADVDALASLLALYADIDDDMLDTLAAEAAGPGFERAAPMQAMLDAMFPEFAV